MQLNKTDFKAYFVIVELNYILMKYTAKMIKN